MKLLTKELKKKIPPLYAQEKAEDPVVFCKFFTPDSSFSWYILEFGGDDNPVFFCFVHNLADPSLSELGYVALKELEEARGIMGLPIERDRLFQQTTLSKLRAKLNC